MEEMKETQESLQRKREQALQRLRRERTEEALWDCVTAYQDFEFHTYSGLPYSYHMKYGRSGTYTKELWINRREKSKSLVWSSVRSAYQKVLELQQESERPVVERPKALGDIRGITYIYGIFYEFALLEMPEKAKEKIKLTLQKKGNNFKEVFAVDYAQWVKYEVEGSPRLNSCARAIMFTYCPFPKEIRKRSAENPMYEKIVKRFENNRESKLKRYQNVRTSMLKAGVEPGEEFEKNIEFFEM